MGRRRDDDLVELTYIITTEVVAIVQYDMVVLDVVFLARCQEPRSTASRGRVAGSACASLQVNATRS